MAVRGEVVSPFTLHLGDCLDALRQLPDASVDAVVTDPPYGLSFMGKKWDYDVPSVEVWAECLRVLKPGGHLLAFAGTRTQHRMAVRIEDAGFEIRDMIAWVYGSGFPKSLDVSKAIDRRGGASVAWFGPWFRKWRDENGIAQKQVAALFPSKTGNITGCVANWELGLNMPTPEQFNLIRDTFGLPFASVEEAERQVVGQQGGNLLAVAPGQDNDRSATTLNITAPATDAARQWQGWGTALKPALEPITVARKPLAGTVAESVLAHGTGALNIDGCRVGRAADDVSGWSQSGSNASENRAMSGANYAREAKPDADGRWPANLIHDGSEEVLALFPNTASGVMRGGTMRRDQRETQSVAYGVFGGNAIKADTYGDAGSAARFFYCPKASKKDREEGLDGFAKKASGMVSNTSGQHLTRRDEGCEMPQRANNHPTVKPTDLMRYLCRLVTPPGGTVLDPFMGSGSTGKAAILEGFRFIGCERDSDYLAIARARIAHAAGVDPLDSELEDLI